MHAANLVDDHNDSREEVVVTEQAMEVMVIKP